MAEISIIMPVYNVEKYLTECLDSLLAQTFTDWEAICVNDGSKDSSLSILQQYAEKDCRIRILDQDNSGAAASRNNGMKLATGKYWIFLDSDDRFLPGLLSHLYGNIKKTSAQISACAYSVFDTNSGKKVLTYQYSGNVTGQTMPFSAKASDLAIMDFHYAPWVYLYDADYIRSLDLQFQNIPRNNDIFFTISALWAADRVTVSNAVLLEYRVGMTTNLQSGRCKTPLTFLEAYDAIYKRFEEYGLLPLHQQRFAEYVLESGLARLKRCQGKAPLETIYFAYREKAIPAYVPKDSLAVITKAELKRFYQTVMETDTPDDFLLQMFFHSEPDEKVARLYGKIDILDDKYEVLIHSPAYRLGRSLLAPLRLLRYFFNLLKGCKNG